MSERNLGTLVTFNPCAVRRDETLADLAQRLESSGFHHWPVVDDQRRLIGIVSDADVVRHLAARRAAQTAWDDGASPAGVLVELTAADIMSPRVVHVSIDASPEEALSRLLRHQIHSLPVVDDEMLVGIVTSSDFLREVSAGELPGDRDPVSWHMFQTTESVDAQLTLDEARMAIVTTATPYLPVTKGECPLGVISQRMLRKAKNRQLLDGSLHDGPLLAAVRVMELVKTAPTVETGDHLSRAATLMIEHLVQAVAVVSKGRRLLGVISEDDILKAALAGLQTDPTTALTQG